MSKTIIRLKADLNAFAGDLLLVEGENVTVVDRSTAALMAELTGASVPPDVSPSASAKIERRAGWGPISRGTEAAILVRAETPINEGQIRVLTLLSRAGDWVGSHTIAVGARLNKSVLHVGCLYGLLGRDWIERRPGHTKESRWEYKITPQGLAYIGKHA